MKITGIVVEYNPMHNGHIYHLEQTKRLTGCDAIVGVMSGNFVQRGEPSFINKWSRTKMALMGGVDLVLELPLIYSISSAEGFAFGAVSTLDSLGIVDNICFGSECGNIDHLFLIANILTHEPTSYKNFLQEQLNFGISFPNARQNALTDYIITNNIEKVNSDLVQNTITSSNNILAVEYIKALIKISSNIKPFTINRISNNYNDNKLTGIISSATAIRQNYGKNDIQGSLPEYSIDILNNEIEAGKGPVNLESFSELILYKLRNRELSFIEDLLDVEEGLHYRIKKASEDTGSINALINSIKNKRYTTTRIQRILMYSLLDITKGAKEKIKAGPEYIRVLGFNSKGKEILNKIKKTSPLPIITNPSAKDAELLKYDIHATDTYVLGYNSPTYKYAKQDLKTPPVIL